MIAKRTGTENLLQVALSENERRKRGGECPEMRKPDTAPKKEEQNKYLNLLEKTVVNNSISLDEIINDIHKKRNYMCVVINDIARRLINFNGLIRVNEQQFYRRYELFHTSTRKTLIKLQRAGLLHRTETGLFVITKEEKKQWDLLTEQI